MNLADPELELIDPTPNIHSLFVHFDELFFWTKLMGRALVRWSKRMYSCAGICSYEGRNGLCDIALSEPLLKLRPRKDLIETLLHEMIHAYLFITNRDNDRDGHGPNFQAHMHRINRAAGLNISIYHDFHDEVKLYLKHWWRCNGICQKMKPYFGVVRRSSNRAPGPSDYWWNAHQKKCGGTFIKIKEPEKIQKAKKTDKSKAKGDITKFINNINTSSNKNDKKYVDKENKVTSNITGTKIAVPKSNIDDAKKLADSGRKRSNSNSVVETVRNVWANKQLPTLPGAVKTTNTSASNWKKHKSNSVQVDSPPKKIKKIDDYFKATASSILKDVYGEEFIISQSTNSPKLKAIAVSDSVKTPPVNVFVNCPNCNKQVYSNDINKHLDECLNKDIIEKLSKECPSTKTDRKSKDLGDVNIKFKPKTEVKVEKDEKSELKSIVGNIQTIPPFRFKPEHSSKDAEPNNADRTINSQDNKLHVKPSTSREIPIQKCPSCSIKIDIPLELHLDKCLKFFDNNATIPEEGISDLDTVVIDDEFNPFIIKSEPGTSITEVQKCPCCGTKIEKPIEEHLDECLSFFDNNTTIPTEGTSVIETIVIDDDEDDIFDESQTFNATGTKSPCPCCLKMIEIADMNEHLDVCLSTSVCE